MINKFKRNKPKKKAQITVYIILGIVLLIIISLAGYFTYKSITNDTQLLVEKEQVPESFKIVDLFITNCLDQVSKEALIKLGSHGGYIELNDPQLHSKYFNLNQFDSVNSDAVLFSENYYIPYWMYLVDDITCDECKVSLDNIPTIQDMQDQMEKYIVREFPNCINHFESSIEQGFEVKESNTMDANVLITKDQVQIHLKHPVTVKKGEESTKIENFFATQDVPLQDLYDLSKQITTYFANQQQMEKITLSLITMYSHLDSNALPPMFEHTSSYDKVMWSKVHVKETLKNILSTTIPLISFKNTANENHITSSDFSQYQQGTYDLLYLDLFQQEIPFEVNVHYFDFSYYLDITPNSGDLLQPKVRVYEFFMNQMPAEHVNDYEFYYDIAYPLIIQLRDTKSFGGEGYNFFFGYEANIRDNRDLFNWNQGLGTVGEVPPRVIHFISDPNKINLDATASFDGSNAEANSKNNPPSNMIPAVGTGSSGKMKIVSPEEAAAALAEKQKQQQFSSKSLFCEPSQRLSGNVEMFVKDKLSGELLNDVLVSYSCGLYDSCILGTTKTTDQTTTDDTNGVEAAIIKSGKFVTKLPLCEGGYLSFKKQGYATESVLLSPQKNKDEQLSISMLAVPELEVEIKKIPLILAKGLTNPSSSQAFLKQNVHDLGDHEQVILNIVKERTSLLESTEYSLFDSFAPKKIIMMPGKYSITATVMNHDGTIIAANTYDMGDTTITTKPIEVKPLVMGGVVINKETGYFEVTAQMLNKLNNPDTDGSGKITFYILEFPKPTSQQDLQEINNLELYSRQFHQSLLPEIQ